ncbi:alpha/beta hydrolase [Nocardioides jensenii]|uniref:alpha/beta hydrolase n=1 Tax=Nocardioides jensenii TaxID=1843 RepID=UPI001C3F3E46|nr:alpha/beta hydrolase [Nocardioides jensenii]
MTLERWNYGPHPDQHAELHLPSGSPQGVVVVVHGGFWKVAYGLEHGRALAEDLARRGWVAWNLEYRRVGGDGGVPETFDDVSAGVDLLSTVPGLNLGRVVALGHSAGGHLAMWAASRDRHPRWREGAVRIAAVVSQAGVLDLCAAHEQGLGSDAVAGLLGSAPGPAHACLDPISQIPLGIPVGCLHPTEDDTVPVVQSREFVRRVRAAGGVAELVEVPGDHFAPIQTGTVAWAETVAMLDRLVR